MIDLDSYREQLNQSLAQATGQDYQPNLASENDQPAPVSYGIDQPDNSADAAMGGQNMPTSSNLGATAQPQQAPPQNIDIMPPGKDLKFDNDKLQNAKTLEDHVDAMTPASRKEYLNWYEKRFGNINDGYEQMLQTLGKKPDEDRPLSKKEKWTALMNFGIAMLRNSSNPNNTFLGAAAQSVGDTVQGIGQERQQEVDQYNKNLAAAGTIRDTQLKNLGTYGDALKGQSTLDRNAALNAKDADAPNQVTKVLDTNQGLVGVTHNGNAIPLKANGKPLKSNPATARGNSDKLSSERDHWFTYFKNQGLSDQEAMDKATEKTYTKPENKPSKSALFDQADKAARNEVGTQKQYRPSKNGGKSYAQALAEAREKQYKTKLRIAGYEPDEADKDLGSDSSSTPAPTTSSPPVSALQPGKITTFKNGQRWTIGADGKPKQVN